MDVASREEKEAILEMKLEQIRQKNAALERRHKVRHFHLLWRSHLNSQSGVTFPKILMDILIDEIIGLSVHLTVSGQNPVSNLTHASGSGHETVAVLLPGFAINW